MLCIYIYIYTYMVIYIYTYVHTHVQIFSMISNCSGRSYFFDPHFSFGRHQAKPTLAVDGSHNDRPMSVDGLNFDPYHRRRRNRGTRGD